MRKATLAVSIAALAAGLAAAADGRAEMVHESTDIPPQELAPALRTLAKTYNFQIVFASQDVQALRTQGAVGNFTAQEALGRLLAGTGLTYRYLSDDTVTLVSASAPDTRADPASRSDTQEVGKSSSRPFRLAQEAHAVPAEPTSLGSSQSRSAPSEGGELDEVVVTAQKRAELLKDVPVPVTLINAQALVDSNQVALQDYYERVPGLVVAGSAAGPAYTISLRGIGNWGGGPAVSILIDDVPFGSSTFFGGGSNYPDVDPSDLARVEVLRGPQGTLYGASSMGGLIKYVTLDPSVEGISGRVEAGTSTVYNAPGLGYSARGAINLPVNDTLALRVSTFTREDPGYIDDILTGKSGINTERAQGGHLAVLWKPSDDFSVKLSALADHHQIDGWNDVEAGLGDLQQRDSAGVGYYWQDEAYSATVSGNVGPVTINSISGYNIRESSGNTDYSAYASFFKNGIDGALSTAPNKTNKFTQEVRLSSTILNRLDWLIGGFYTHETSDNAQTLFSVNPMTGQNFGTGFYSDNPDIYAELAGFADLTLHVTDRFDVQVGGRYSEIRETTLPSYTVEPIFIGSSVPIIGAEAHVAAQPVTYLFTPSYKLSPDLMLYARLASGYRAGGRNLNGCNTFDFPCEYQPDKTKNYEIGAKGDLYERLLSFDASVYYIDWSNFQIGEVKTLSYVANAGDAKSQGVELSLESRPLMGLTMSVTFAYSDAVLTRDLPAATEVVGYSGDSLPFTSRYSGNLSLNQQFVLRGALTGFVGSTVSYVSNRQGIFAPVGAGPRDNFPAYTKIDLLAGVREGAWSAKIYANNVADTRGQVNGGLSNFPTGDINYIRPRTIGLSAEWKF